MEGVISPPAVGVISPQEASAESIQLAWRGISCADEDQVRDNAEKVATLIEKAASLHPVIVLDSIWEGDFGQIYLPDYVKARSTTMSFPEKVRIPI